MKHTLSEEEFEKLIDLTEGYSNADLVSVVHETAMIPIREIPTEQLLEIKDASAIRGVTLEDFVKSIQ